MSEKHHILDLKGMVDPNKGKLHIFGVPEAVDELMSRLRADRILLDAPDYMFYIVESQAGAGSQYEVFPLNHGYEAKLVKHVTELTQENIRYHIYKVLGIEELEVIPARICTKTKPTIEWKDVEVNK